MPSERSTPRPRARRPWWAWLLVGLCFLIAIVALSVTKWMLGLIGLGAAVTVMNISGSTERTPKARLVACLMVTAVAWMAFIVFSAAIARL